MKNFDFKNFFFFLISLGSLLLLIYVLIQEIRILRENMDKEKTKKILVHEKHALNLNSEYRVYTSTEIKKQSNLDKKEEKNQKIIIKAGAFKNKENAEKVISKLKKENYNYKLEKKGLFKIYVIAKNEEEREKIFELLKSMKIKPLVVNKFE